MSEKKSVKLKKKKKLPYSPPKETDIKPKRKPGTFKLMGKEHKSYDPYVQDRSRTVIKDGKKVKENHLTPTPEHEFGDSFTFKDGKWVKVKKK